MNKGRLQAFTILEVTIAMLLAAITIGIAYTAYTLVGRSYREYDRKNGKVAEFVLVSKLLNKDISAARTMVRIGDGISLEDSMAITYRFFPEYILRDQYSLETDTFFVANSELVSSFEGKETVDGEITDKAGFKAVLEGKEVPMVFLKVYSAEEMFK